MKGGVDISNLRDSEEKRLYSPSKFPEAAPAVEAISYGPSVLPHLVPVEGVDIC